MATLLIPSIIEFRIPRCSSVLFRSVGAYYEVDNNKSGRDLNNFRKANSILGVCRYGYSKDTRSTQIDRKEPIYIGLYEI